MTQGRRLETILDQSEYACKREDSERGYQNKDAWRHGNIFEQFRSHMSQQKVDGALFTGKMRLEGRHNAQLCMTCKEIWT